MGGAIACSMGGGGQGDNFEIVDLHICIYIYIYIYLYKISKFRHLYMKVWKYMNRDARKYELKTMKKTKNYLKTFQNL